MTEKQDAVWLKQQQKTSQSCHKPPDKLTAYSVYKYANNYQKMSHIQTDTGSYR